MKYQDESTNNQSLMHGAFQVGAVPLNSTHNSTAPTDYYYYRNLMHLGWPHTFTSSRMHWIRCQDMKYQDELTNNQSLMYGAFQVGAIALNSTHNSTAPTDYYYYRNLMHLGWAHTFTSSRMHWIRCQDMKYQDELTNNQLLTYNFPGGHYSTE